MHLVEYRICLPFTVEEYKRAQLYMIARHCDQESERGEGVEVVKYETCEDPKHGNGHYTEKHIHLYKKLPTWMHSFIPNIFYIIEKSWNYYPYTITEYTCAFLPRLHICVLTKYEDNTGESENSHNLTTEELNIRTIDYIDISTDHLSEHKYKESEDPRKINSVKTNRGPLLDNWQKHVTPIMCAYKIVKVKFEVFGFQTRVEAFAQRTIREILLLAHRQAFAWIDEWYDLPYEKIVQYERETYARTNQKVLDTNNNLNNHKQQQQQRHSNNDGNSSKSKHDDQDELF